ncbi:MAG: AAA family ATPase, partial [Candidatus Latescibacterota bacterium]
MITGYRLEAEIANLSGCRLWAGVRCEDSCPVTVKSCPRRPWAAEAVAGLRHEYELLRPLRLSGVAAPLDLVEDLDSVSLVLQRVPGLLLCDATGGHRPSLPDFLDIAVALAGAVTTLHDAGIVHARIGPATVFWDPGSKCATLTGFEYGWRTDGEGAPRSLPHVADDALPFTAPELTRRAKLPVDQRADLYGLGALLYWLLAGVAPFGPGDRATVLHAILAGRAAPPHQHAPAVPEVLSGIVMELLSKDPEDRYRSARELEWELRPCRAELETTGSLDGLRRAVASTPPRLAIADRLYGREQEVETLREAYRQTQSHGPVLVLVSGQPGVGKTSAILGALEGIAGVGERLLSGKFDQYSRSRPYAAFVAACEAWVRRALAAPQGDFARWGQQLREALGANAALMAGLVPPLGVLLGARPEAVSLGVGASGSRLHTAWANLLGAIGNGGRPAVLFLDDLQWLDPASRPLLEDLLAASGLTDLFVVGAYRDNEVGGGHPLLSVVDTIRRAGVPVTQLCLQPMRPADLECMVAEALQCGRARAADLAAAVHAKTGGNPFHAKAFLRSLHDRGLLTYDRAECRWAWNRVEVAELAVTENVVEFLVGEMHALPLPIRSTLACASYIGDTFGSRLAAACLGRAEAEVAADLQQAAQRGYVAAVVETGDPVLRGHVPAAATAPRPATYRFVHDRCREAARGSQSEAERAAQHLAVGRQLLREMQGPRVGDDRLLPCAEHMNAGWESTTSPAERRVVAHLNLQAGRQAKAAAAFEQARAFLTTGIAQLGTGAWQEEYKLALTLHEEAAEAAYLCGQHEAAKALVDAVAAHAQRHNDTVLAGAVRVASLTA